MYIKQIIDKEKVDELYEDGHIYSKFGEYIRKKHGFRIFKVPMNAGFTCPNWDGRLSDKGCIYCPDLARQFTYESFRKVIDKDIGEQVCDQMVEAGLRAILNFAPVRVRAPEEVLVKTVDLKVHLEELCFFLAHAATA